ncbi:MULTISPECIES: homoserine kinase [unclassified Acinetobacter]|uniref:homoserine kinase n=1 Tax=unclassified Acinetobacter TaxID=196816 RepID=UPI00190DD81E|nr:MULTISPECIES: homoserine kinase [unclassified Acinetobacter]MBK0063431.1 homoserine kinase [Acinetobacter sp. S55]MBK0065498.1 homoserine kinase [Acinetobacter sp. S54]
MSVYTPLSLEQVQAFALPYGLEVVNLIPIQGGIENTNYFLVTQDHQQYVLTVFEELDQQGANELPPVLQYLGQQGVPVAVPLSYAGQFIHVIADKPAQIAPKIAGRHPIPPTLKQIIGIGKAQAQLHMALQNFQFKRQSYRNHAYWTNVADQLRSHMNQDDLELLDRVYQLFNQQREQHPDLPQGWIHSDLFRDNTLFDEDVLEGILDFSEMNQDDLLFDVAIAINDFCTEHPSAQLNSDKLNAFVEGYHTVRQFTSDEQSCLAVYLAMAACRFWLLRLQVAERNAQEVRQGDDILQKNPIEMRRLLESRLAHLTG